MGFGVRVGIKVSLPVGVEIRIIFKNGVNVRVRVVVTPAGLKYNFTSKLMWQTTAVTDTGQGEPAM